MSRKLASIQKVINIKPIVFVNEKGENEIAGAIEEITIQGWNLVAKKGEFKVGDNCIYFEIDSFLPIDKPQFAFLLKNGTKKMLIENKEVEGIRLKTMKLKGVVSQGLALPINIFPEVEKYIENINNFDENGEGNYNIEGLDLTSLLQVEKYEKPIPAELAGIVKGDFPSFISKTDEPRIQSNIFIFENYKEEDLYATEKLDGSSITIYLKEKQKDETGEKYLDFGVCSRNLDLLETDKNTFWNTTRKLEIEEKLRLLYAETGIEYALQGELVGEGIQGNPLKIKGHNIYFYNVFDITNQNYLDFKDFTNFISKLGLNTVPIIHTSIKLNKFETIDDIVKFVTIKSSINKETWQEGFVFRSITEKKDEKLGRLSFKCISPMFLLNGGD